jgi:hypothetical protein
MVLQNYVELEEGVPARLHFFNHALVTKTITDSITREPALRNTLVFDVDRLDGREVNSKLSIMADKFADKFAPYLDDKSYRNYDFLITFNGSGFRRTYTVQAIPLTR